MLVQVQVQAAAAAAAAVVVDIDLLAIIEVISFLYMFSSSTVLVKIVVCDRKDCTQRADFDTVLPAYVFFA
jgi:hypothetical protein